MLFIKFQYISECKYQARSIFLESGEGGLPRIFTSKQTKTKPNFANAGREAFVLSSFSIIKIRSRENISLKQKTGGGGLMLSV